MTKSPDAFRTISEVAEWLDRPAHVLRFWESKFTQVKPIKRAGGRRYYRPQDMLLLGGIKKLLHDDGMTIKGVQKLLREQGVAHVSALSHSLDAPAETGDLVPSPEKIAALRARTEAPESATLLQFPATAPAPIAENPDSELSPTSYEEAIEEYSPEADDSVQSPIAGDDADVTIDADGIPMTEDSAEPADEGFETPSFFDVFDQSSDAPAVADDSSGDAADELAPFESIPDPVVAPTTIQEALAEAETPVSADEQPQETAIDTPAPEIIHKPTIVDVPVSVTSHAGPGVLTRLFQNQAAIAQADSAQLIALRDQISSLKSRLSGF